MTPNDAYIWQLEAKNPKNTIAVLVPAAGRVALVLHSVA